MFDNLAQILPELPEFYIPYLIAGGIVLFFILKKGMKRIWRPGIWISLLGQFPVYWTSLISTEYFPSWANSLLGIVLGSGLISVCLRPKLKKLVFFAVFAVIVWLIGSGYFG